MHTDAAYVSAVCLRPAGLHVSVSNGSLDTLRYNVHTLNSSDNSWNACCSFRWHCACSCPVTSCSRRAVRIEMAVTPGRTFPRFWVRGAHCAYAAAEQTIRIAPPLGSLKRPIAFCDKHIEK